MLDRMYLTPERLAAGEIYRGSIPWYVNYPTMILSAAAVYADIGFQLIEYYPRFRY